MALEVTGFNYFLPLFVFILVFFIVYAVLAKLKLTGENKFVHMIVSFIVAIIFLTFTSTRELIIQSTPWFAVMLVLVFFVLMLVGFTQKSLDSFMKPWLAWIVVVLFVIIFLVVLLQIFGYSLLQFFGNIGEFSRDYPKAFGALVILVVAALASWVVAKK